MLYVFCLISMCQSCTWNIFGPIYPAAFRAFPSWTDSFLSWVINSANLALALALYPVSVCVKRMGPRRVTQLSATMIFMCTAVRCLPVGDGQLQRSLVVLSMLCNGCAGPWLNFGAPILSELWFPSGERTVATAIATVAVYAGGAVGFVIGPAVVGCAADGSGDSVCRPEEARAAIDRLFYLEAAVCLCAMLCCSAYFPDHPEHPPSEAAAAKRARASGGRHEQPSPPCDAPGVAQVDRSDCGGQDGVGDIVVYFGRGRTPAPPSALAKYWALSVGMALPLGVSQAWSSVLFSCLSTLSITQDEAAWLGFAMTMAGCASSVLVGAMLDRCAGRLKLVTSVLMVAGTASLVVFSANASGYLPSDGAVAVAYASGIAGGVALNVAVPLLFELIMEAVYGWGDEGGGTMISMLLNTVVQIAFLLVLAGSPPESSKLWTAWANAASFAACGVLVLGLRVEYRRLALDRGSLVSETGCYFDRAIGCY